MCNGPFLSRNSYTVHAPKFHFVFDFPAQCELFAWVLGVWSVCPYMFLVWNCMHAYSRPTSVWILFDGFHTDCARTILKWAAEPLANIPKVCRLQNKYVFVLNVFYYVCRTVKQAHEHNASPLAIDTHTLAIAIHWANICSESIKFIVQIVEYLI